MKSVKFLLPAACLLTLSACGGEPSTEQATAEIAEDKPALSFNPEKMTRFVGKKHGPVRIAYRFVGEPVVGQPMTVDLDFMSNVGTAPIQVSYRVPDSTALQIPQDQLREVAVAPGTIDGGSRSTAGHQVTVVPLREGRIYLNVSAEVETPDGTMSTVTAIPLQVGDAPRTLRENGTLMETESGETVRSMPAKQ